MKKLSFILLLLVVTSILFAQNPPKSIDSAFNKRFPKAKEVKWSKENKQVWEAEFLDYGDKTSALFSQDGTWLETETEIEKADLPDNVILAVRKEYPDCHIIIGEEIEKPGTQRLYYVTIRVGIKKTLGPYNKKGELVK